MSFKKVRYNTGEEIAEIRIKDSYGAEIAKWVVLISDFPKAAEIIKNKFGVGLKKKGDKDLDWALQ